MVSDATPYLATTSILRRSRSTTSCPPWRMPLGIQGPRANTTRPDTVSRCLRELPQIGSRQARPTRLHFMHSFARHIGHLKGQILDTTRIIKEGSNRALRRVQPSRQRDSGPDLEPAKPQGGKPEKSIQRGIYARASRLPSTRNCIYKRRTPMLSRLWPKQYQGGVHTVRIAEAPRRSSDMPEPKPGLGQDLSPLEKAL